MLRNSTTAGTLVLSSLLLATPALAQESATQMDVVDPGDEPRSELLDPRGVVLDYGLDGLGQTYADLLVQTRGLGGEVQVLPEEPVGIGAVWQSYTEIFESRLTYESGSTTTLAAVDGTTLALEQEHSTSSQPNLGLERLGVSAGAIYTSQQVEGSASTELALDSLVQTGSGDVRFLVIAGTSAGGYGSEL